MKLTKKEKTELLKTVLVDDTSSYGGTSFEGETLEDFLLESNAIDILDKENALTKINAMLNECGILEINLKEEVQHG